MHINRNVGQQFDLSEHTQGGIKLIPEENNQHHFWHDKEGNFLYNNYCLVFGS
jgi:hypothetical protein